MRSAKKRKVRGEQNIDQIENLHHVINTTSEPKWEDAVEKNPNVFQLYSQKGGRMLQKPNLSTLRRNPKR